MKPIKVKRRQGTLLTDGHADTIMEYPADLAEQMAARTVVLFDRYKVELGDWRGLALGLALMHEPEFMVEFDSGKSRRTKPIKWGIIRQLFLWWDVKEFKRQHRGQTIESICYKLWMADEYWGKSAGVMDSDSLRARYNDANKSPMVEMAKKAIESIGREAFAEALAGMLDRREEMFYDEYIAFNGKPPEYT
ncbi:hypothetical protein FJY94_07685 [Candidatus Kaiserbacteria bacterium]|nr:hypothetical protein [Candidatus Kaiserbacteria bacterium]